MRIGELARRTGVSVRALRYYEEQQLLLPARTAGGQRTFAETDVDRVQLVQLLFAAGVPSSAVVEVLPCALSGTTTPAMVERLEAERDALRERVRTLRATLEALDDVVAVSRERLAPVAATA